MPFESICPSKEHLNILVAFTDKNRYISYENELPWKMSLKGDMRFVNKFIRIEPNTILIVGRRTYESIPKYKDVKVVVVSRKGMEDRSIKSFKSFVEAVEYARMQNMFVIVFGGVEIYAEAMKHKHRIFCTIVKEGELKGDRIFPELDTPLTNISRRVNDFLLENSVPKTWSFKQDENAFEENGFKYSFFYGES